MSSVGHSISTTETTNSQGFINDYVVPGTWSIVGVLAQEQTGVAELVKVDRNSGRHYEVRCFNRQNDGTLAVLANTQVDVLLVAIQA